MNLKLLIALTIKIKSVTINRIFILKQEIFKEKSRTNYIINLIQRRTEQNFKENHILTDLINLNGV